MRLKREVSLGLGAILGLQILLSTLAISLLMRMGPAIEHILEENVYSGEAVEEMLATLADAQVGENGGEREGEGVADSESASFFAALARAEDNITEDAEEPLLETIRARAEAALEGEGEARAAVIAALRELGHVNRESMIAADTRAKRLGQAGAWAAVLLGALALALGIAVYRRLRLRLELPVDALRRATHRIRAGNAQARCAIHDAPAELNEIASNLNWILDRALRHERVVSDPPSDDRETEIRRLLAWLLDLRERPTVVVDNKGNRVASSHDAMSLDLPAPGELDDLESSSEWSARDVPGTPLLVLERREGVV